MAAMMLARRLVLAALLCLGGAGVVLAHALPGSVLTFSAQEDGLALQMQVTVEDLVFAAPDLAFLKQEPIGQDLPEAMLSRLSAYLGSHMAAQQGDAGLSFTLTGAQLSQETDAHAGQYLALNVLWSVQGASDLPLTLQYDAILHEVRTHRVVVYWQSEDGARQGLARFGYQSRAGVDLAR